MIFLYNERSKGHEDCMCIPISSISIRLKHFVKTMCMFLNLVQPYDAPRRSPSPRERRHSAPLDLGVRLAAQLLLALQLLMLSKPKEKLKGLVEKVEARSAKRIGDTANMPGLVRKFLM